MRLQAITQHARSITHRSTPTNKRQYHEAKKHIDSTNRHKKFVPRDKQQDKMRQTQHKMTISVLRA